MSRPDDELLDLTVVSLPRPGDQFAPEQARGRLKLLAILLLCSLPLILSYLAFYVLRPQGKAAVGDLISPARPMPEVLATRLDGSALPSRAGEASVVMPDDKHGRAYLAYNNYMVLRSWNRSNYFVISVGYLADRIVGG